MTEPPLSKDLSDLHAYKDELIEQVNRGGALVAGVADAAAFNIIWRRASASGPAARRQGGVRCS